MSAPSIRDFKIVVNNLFDTQMASRFLGIRATSLEAVLHARFQVQLDKRFQRKRLVQKAITIKNGRIRRR